MSVKLCNAGPMADSGAVSAHTDMHLVLGELHVENIPAMRA